MDTRLLDVLDLLLGPEHSASVSLAAPRLATIATGGYVVARRMNRSSAPYR